MAPPSQLKIATDSLNRLVKEEASYHKELEQQQKKLAQMKQEESNDENADYLLKQQAKVVGETQNVIAPLREKISQGIEHVDRALAQAPEDTSADEREKAEAAKNSANAVLKA